jgi:hypothetical protein
LADFFSAGCVTCKARRVKYDETKPTCSQCARRTIQCSGYEVDFKFKSVDEPTGQPLHRRKKEQASSQTHQSTPVRQPRKYGNTEFPTVGSGTLENFQTQPADFSRLRLAKSGDALSVGTGVIPSGNHETLRKSDDFRPDLHFCETLQVESQDALLHIDFSIPELGEFSAEMNPKDYTMGDVHNP